MPRGRPKLGEEKKPLIIDGVEQPKALSTYTLLKNKHKELLKQYEALKLSKGSIEVVKEIPKEVIKEVIKEVSIKLKENQLIIELNDETIKKTIRLIAYLKQKNKLDGVNKEDYFNVIINTSLNYLVQNEFSQILK